MQLGSQHRHAVLSAAINPNALDGSTDNNIELRHQMMATQTHVCNLYCSGGRASCRFLFPFKQQPRASLAARSPDRKDSRLVALAPRSTPDLNSTHPMLTAMFHSNTDVTVVTGTSVAESSYVCNYAVKADKNPLFDQAALRKLQRMGDGIEDDRKLLGAIARNSTSVRTVGAQEAVDNLLGNPLTFLSADVKSVYTGFFYRT